MIAEPNTVTIAESTRKLIGNLFDLQDLGGQDLKGIVGSVRAWAALRPAVGEDWRELRGYLKKFRPCRAGMVILRSLRLGVQIALARRRLDAN
jgi:hypothetical protein